MDAVLLIFPPKNATTEPVLLTNRIRKDGLPYMSAHEDHVCFLFTEKLAWFVFIDFLCETTDRHLYDWKMAEELIMNSNVKLRVIDRISRQTEGRSMLTREEFDREFGGDVSQFFTGVLYGYRYKHFTMPPPYTGSRSAYRIDRYRSY